MKTNKTYLLILLSAFFTVTAFAQADAKKNAKKENEKKFEHTKMDDESEFVVDVADGGMFEVQAASLAKTKTSSVKVKTLADLMLKDHSMANDELKKLASKKNITIPTKLSEKRQKQFNELNKLNGIDFDKEYAKEMVNDHKKDIDAFQKEADKGKDADIRNWASQLLPKLKHHLTVAENTVNALKETAEN